MFTKHVGVKLFNIYYNKCAFIVIWLQTGIKPSCYMHVKPAVH